VPTISSPTQEAYFIPSRRPAPAASLFKSADMPVDRFDSTQPGDPGLIPPRRPQSGTPAPEARPYYDAAADQAAQQTYYQGLELSSDPKQAYTQLSKLVKETHSKELEYAPEKYVYPWVDRRPNGEVQSIYSPDSVVRLTPAKSDAIDASMAQAAFFAPFSPETVAAHMSLVQSAGALNCEHVVPQSWFDGKEPMRGDLHHLFACDSRCNSYRGNLEFTESSGAVTDEIAKCGIRTGGGFEPNAGHGAVARATLYFLLRYPKKAKAYDADEIAMLVRWSKKDPPSLYEQHRNAAIQELQGNRNPFIDHPEWVDKVDFLGPARRRQA